VSIKQKRVLYSPSVVLSEYIASRHQKVRGERHYDVITDQENSANVVFGNNYTFRVNQNGFNWFMTGLKLKINVGAMSQTGGSFVRLGHLAGLHFFDRIEILGNTETVLRTLYNEDLVSYYVHMLDKEELEYQKSLIGYEKTAGTRNTAAGSAQEFVLDLGKVLAMFQKPLPLFLLRGEHSLRVRVYYKSNINEIAQYDGTVPLFASHTHSMDVEYIAAPSNVVEYVKQKSISMGGWRLFNHHVDRLDFNQATGASFFRHQLDMVVNKDVVAIMLIPRVSSEITSTTLRDYTNYQTIQDYALKINNERIHDSNVELTNAFYKNVLIDSYEFKNKSEVKTDNIYYISYSDSLNGTFGSHEDIEEKHHEYHGSKNFSQYNTNPNLEVNYTGNLGATNNLTVLAWSVRYLQITNQGHLSDW
jgi:hypothetical protein